jgi:hypothetical protein
MISVTKFTTPNRVLNMAIKITYGINPNNRKIPPKNPNSNAYPPKNKVDTKTDKQNPAMTKIGPYIKNIPVFG